MTSARRFNSPFKRIRSVQFGSVFAREVEVDRHVVLGFSHGPFEFEERATSWSVVTHRCARAASAESCAKMIPITAVIICRWLFAACAITLRVMCIRLRCEVTLPTTVRATGCA